MDCYYKRAYDSLILLLYLIAGYYKRAYDSLILLLYRIARIFGKDFILHAVDRVPNLDMLILSITDN